jgi:RNA polymerase sigma factor (sigma-70 family)
MNVSVVKAVVEDLNTLYSTGAIGGLPDGQLLDRWVSERDEAAFEILVERHAALVWGVCRRILGSHHDAEDAFQASFLVLARKADSIVPREKLPNWLFGVAYHIAFKQRAGASSRQRREKQVVVLPEPQVSTRARSDECLGSLDRELRHLPERYRTAILLCELDGLSHQAAADRLGCPIGTLSARLSRARALLARRLKRRGLTVSAGGLSTLLAPTDASASPPSSIVSSLSQASVHFARGETAAPGLIASGVLRLAERELKAMQFAKLKAVSAILVSLSVLGPAAALFAAPRGPTIRAVPQTELGVQRSKDKPTADQNRANKGPILSGRVVDESGQPMAGAKIVLYSGFATRWKGQEATTDRDGRYRINPLQTGSMTKRADADKWDYYVGMQIEHPTHVSADGSSWRDITVPNIDRKETIYNYSMVPGGRIKGRVLDPKTKAPVAGMDLRFLSPSPRNAKFHTYATTDKEGRFTTETLFPARYVIDVNSSELGYVVLGNVPVTASETFESAFSFETLQWAATKAIEAHSGSMRLGSLRAMAETTRETYEDGKKTTRKELIQLPDRYRCEIRDDGDDKTLVCIFDGVEMKRWYKNDDGAVREAKFTGIEHPPEYWRDFIKFFGPRAVLRLKDTDYQRSLLDETLIGGRAAFGIRLVKTLPNFSIDLRMFFDQETGKLVRLMNALDGTELTFSDYKEFHAVPVARKTTRKANGGKSVSEQELIDFESEKELDAQLFKMP